jgi:hypothetical protein
MNDGQGATKGATSIEGKFTMNSISGYFDIQYLIVAESCL